MSPYYFYKITFCEDTIIAIIKDMNDDSTEITVKLSPMDFLNYQDEKKAKKSTNQPIQPTTNPTACIGEADKQVG